MRAESQTRAGITPFQAGDPPSPEPSRERLDGPVALTFAHVSVVNAQRAARWHPGFPEDRSGWSGADWSNAMCGEAGEVANVVKKIRRQECGLRGVLDKNYDGLRADLEEEMADVFIYLDLLATYYDIDLPSAVMRKFNLVSEIQGFPERLP